jgi:hypothetical protein
LRVACALYLSEIRSQLSEVQLLNGSSQLRAVGRLLAKVVGHGYFIPLGKMDVRSPDRRAIFDAVAAVIDELCPGFPWAAAPIIERPSVRKELTRMRKTGDYRPLFARP